ncbi:hypothetical protein AGABI2DRAFT_191018 [Agaricus bisporus var. bisporus H97]|uniref:hypothetical protein n=1 Tax=Agaricus bisporus var. bisporus (strain H97 / ATCC MYA-4626 / FGSC 10389) TaxID=936046 RepID=UPI00029F51CF|nr:hypothetical protein AGABI2DRAFT_191018 [Agaricus bisporus var. bisporus H97]EKV48793.1 hypothetical protein AGABI2DRAFT_191018 [Agaricus bisporus var. bisporus H97]
MSDKIYFHIFNGRKYCVAHSDSVTISIEEVNDDPNLNGYAMWQMIKDGGNYTFKNRSTGSFIVLDHSGIKTSSSTGENSKWQIEPARNLSIDKCRIVKANTGTAKNVFANDHEKLVLAVQKNSGDVTQQADQLFKIVYAGGDN